jgi:hypothetical protein
VCVCVCEEPGRHTHRYIRKHTYVRNLKCVVGSRGRDDGGWQDIVLARHTAQGGRMPRHTEER